MVLIQLLLPTLTAVASHAMTPLAETRRDLADIFCGVYRTISSTSSDVVISLPN
jgi:hypothetical protein